MEDIEVIVLFSANQLSKDTEIYKKVGKTYLKKYVIVKGKKVQYTDIVAELKLMKFSDSKTIIKGKKSELTFITE